MGELTFKRFSAANKERCEKDFNRPVGPATLIATSLGVAEECGEIIGAIRTFVGITTRKHVTIAEIGDELADCFSYLDLLASSLGLSFEECLIRKFNKVSERQGSKVKLGTEA